MPVDDVDKHWIVAHFTPAVDETPAAIGTVQSTLHDTLPAAIDAAKLLAAVTPGSHYVVYAAEWVAYTDETPVYVAKVGAL